MYNEMNKFNIFFSIGTSTFGENLFPIKSLSMLVHRILFFIFKILFAHVRPNIENSALTIVIYIKIKTLNKNLVENYIPV